MTPLLIAHRGDTVRFPENTLEAFESAFDLGADGIECDVQCDETGNLIVVHNYLYDKSKQYPLLETVLEKLADRGRIEIELKCFETTCLDTLVDLIRRCQPADYEITSSVLPLLPVVRQKLPEASVGMIFKSCLIEPWVIPEFIERQILGYMKLTGANVLHLDWQYYTPELVNALHEHNYKAHTHLKDAALKLFNKVQGMNIDQCTFDDINLLVKVKNKEKA